MLCSVWSLSDNGKKNLISTDILNTEFQDMYNSALQRNQTGQTNVDASLHFH
jgi:hypothetical protein